MPINFPSSPSNNELFVAEGKAMRYNASKGKWRQVATLTSSQITDLEARTVGVSSMSISGNTLVIQKDDSSYANVSLASFAGNKLTTYANASILPLSDLVSGTQVYVEDTDSLYITDGSGWYKIATVNLSPSLTLGVSSISLGPGGSVDVNYTVNEPEDTPYTVSASSTSNATITVYQANNTITFNSPVQNTSETITITATDGINSVGDTLTMSIALLISNSKYTTLLATAVDTSNNSTITDSSSNARSVTITGSPNIGTFSPYRHGGYSLNFSTANDRIQVAEDTTTRVLGNDFTVEGWVYVTGGNSGLRTIIAQGISGVYSPFNVYYDSSVSKFKIDLSSSGSSWDIASQVASSSTYSENAWHHWALVRDGTAFKLYVNGSLDSTIATSSATLMTPTTSTSLGAREDATYDFYGYMRDVRLVIGTAVYSGSSYTVPTEPLEDITNTKLLLCALPYIADKSSNSLTVYRRLGDVLSEGLSPYDHGGYSASDNGGSIHFDGNGDYLTIPSLGNSSVTDFTISFWIYPEDLAINNSLYPRPLSIGNSSGANGFILYWAPDRVLRLYTGGAVRIESTQGAGAVITTNTWHHVVIKRNSGTWRMLIDGVSQGTYSSSSTIDFTSSNMYIGRDTTAAGYLTGYVSDFKIEFSSTSASTATVPTSPYSSSGTELHIKGTDADIIDKAQVSNITVHGNVTGSTAQAKFAGTKSIYFDGSGDAITLPDNSVEYQFGDNDFTIEAWIYTNSSAKQIIVNLSSQSSFGTRFQLSNNLRLEHLLDDGSNNHTLTYEATTGAVSINTWTHVAIVRNGNNIMMFKDGTQVGTTQTISFSLRESPANEIGGTLYFGNWSHPFSGYMQDLRITKGLARYTSNFTPPTLSLEG